MKEFGTLRAIFFPIHGNEIKKFLPMGLMMFFILFNYTVLRDTKDTLVVNAAGAEAMSLLKLFGTVPGAIIILLLYSKLSNMFSREKLFYITITPFLLFFGLFAFVIYPNRELLHPSQAAIQELSLAFPRLKTIFSVYGSWSYGLFYVLSELWGSVVMSLLFWQFANEIIKMHEAKRFYSLFGMVGNFALIASGYAVQHFSQVRGNLAPGVDPWGVTLHYLMGSLVIAGVLLMMVYRFINSKVLTDKRYYNPEETTSAKKDKPKLSIKESFTYLIRSKHLGYIALLVIFYGISINVIEGVWKDQIKYVFGGENAYNAFMGKVSMMTGIITIIFMLIGTNIVRIFGWNVSAKLTPIMILLTGGLFFTFVCFRDSFESYTLAVLSMTPIACAVWIGFAQNILTKATKYSLFDPTKEMCYIPLDQESKVKGKAAIDVVGGRLGKSGGAFLQQFFLVLTGSNLIGIAPYLAGCLAIAALVWLVATSALNKSLQQLESGKPQVVTQKVSQEVHIAAATG
jgi:ATP:ADP antiporter, AAA family